MSCASAATRASDRRRSSRTARHATPQAAIATTIALIVTNMSMTLPQLELDRDLHENIDRCSEPLRGSELPLPHCLNSPCVQTSGQALKNAHVADRPVPPHNDFHHDFAADIFLPRFFRVVGFDFVQQPRRLNAASGPVRSAARPAAGARADAAAATRTESRSRTRARCATLARAVGG